MHNRRDQMGFTLLEVLVALVIITVAMAAMVKAAGSNASNAGYLKEKTLAQWVAMNKITEIRLEKQWPGVDTTQSGEVVYADIEWHWKVKTVKAADQDIRLLEVTVVQESRRDEEPVAQVNAYLVRPQ